MHINIYICFNVFSNVLFFARFELMITVRLLRQNLKLSVVDLP